MSRKVKIGSTGAPKTITVEIGTGTYDIPLAGSMKRKDILALKDEDSVFQMFARYIPEKVLDEMTVDEYNQLANAWTDANDAENNASLGES